MCNMKVSLRYVSLFCFLISCNPKNTFSVTVSSEIPRVDSVYIVESITREFLYQGIGSHGEIPYPTTGRIQTKNGKNRYLTSLYPGKKLNVFIGSDSTIRTDNLADSLLNFLWQSNNEFIGQNSSFIFSSDDADAIIELFNDFEEVRKNEIEKRSSELSKIETNLLLYQNSARIHSFLFYLGRLIKGFPPDHSYFSFIEKIDNNDPWSKTLPHNLLYKHELNYLIKNDSLRTLYDYISYVESQTSDNDLLDFLKAVYIREIIESPSYWVSHQTLFNSEVLRSTIAGEKDNPYVDLIQKSSNRYFSSKKGTSAYNFSAQRMDGKEIRLSDLRGKVVFIDNWASWCGPCLQHRPQVLRLANKYKNNPQVEILMISVDKSKEFWVKYLKTQDQLNLENDLIIENGMRTEYGDKFNIKSIPKYVLINQSGKIIDANISEPSIVVEEMIESALSRN